MHATRKQFIKCKSLEKLRCALRHQVRTGITQSYKNGDVVFYKRNLCDRWLGPGASNISISEENNVEEELGTPSDHIE